MEDKDFQELKKGKEKFLIEVIKNSSFYFIEKIEWLKDIWYEWEDTKDEQSYFLVKISFDWWLVPIYCIQFLDKLSNKYIKETDSYSVFNYVEWNSFYIEITIYSLW